MQLRQYSQETDELPVGRIWKECGWMDVQGEHKHALPSLRAFIECSDAEVGLLNEEVECLVTAHSGTIAMLEKDLPLKAITSVTAGRTVRRMGMAGQLTARAVIRAAAEGNALAALGIFDQGYYDKLGFGTFPYVHAVSLDPVNFNAQPLSRPPIRLSIDDVSRVADNIRRRFHHHGLVKILHKGFLSLSIDELENGFGLGFENSEGQLTHHLWIEPKGEENGPYRVEWLVFEDYSGLMELLSLLKSFADQVNMITLNEPWGVQLQDLMERPFRGQEISRGSKFQTGIVAEAYQQIRILDLNKCLAPLKLPRGEIEFNLKLSDPIESRLDSDSRWNGVGGDWIISMDEEGSSARQGRNSGLKCMETSVNGFTRLIFGVTPASGLAATGCLEASVALLHALDTKLRLPVPAMEQMF